MKSSRRDLLKALAALTLLPKSQIFVQPAPLKKVFTYDILDWKILEQGIQELKAPNHFLSKIGVSVPKNTEIIEISIY